MMSALVALNMKQRIPQYYNNMQVSKIINNPCYFVPEVVAKFSFSHFKHMKSMLLLVALAIP